VTEQSTCNCNNGSAQISLGIVPSSWLSCNAKKAINIITLGMERNEFNQDQIKLLAKHIISSTMYICNHPTLKLLTKTAQIAQLGRNGSSEIVGIQRKGTKAAIAQIAELDRNGAIELVITQKKKSCKYISL
jgi:hypothetical protein